MKVAIVGAGLSGMACAHELRKHDIIPTIYEAKDYIGEALHLPVVVLNVFNSPVHDSVATLNKKYGFKFIPQYIIREINMIGPSKECVVKGNLGYIFRRGRGPNTITQQLMDVTDMAVNMNSNEAYYKGYTKKV